MNQGFVSLRGMALSLPRILTEPPSIEIDRYRLLMTRTAMLASTPMVLVFFMFHKHLTKGLNDRRREEMKSPALLDKGWTDVVDAEHCSFLSGC